MARADLPQPLEVPGRRREAAARVLDGFDEHRGDGVGAFGEDRLLDAVGRPDPERLPFEAVRGAVGVGVGHLERPRHERLERGAVLGDPGDRQRAVRRAVVGDRAADHLGLAGLPGHPEVLLGQLPRRLDGLAAAAGEEHPVEVARRVVGQPLGQVDRRGVRVGPQREERQLLRLPRRGLPQLAAAVADLDGEEPGETVEVGATRVVDDPAPLAAHDDRRRGGLAGEVHPQVVSGGVRTRGAAGCRRRAGHRVPQL